MESPSLEINQNPARFVPRYLPCPTLDEMVSRDAFLSQAFFDSIITGVCLQMHIVQKKKIGMITILWLWSLAMFHWPTWITDFNKIPQQQTHFTGINTMEKWRVLCYKGVHPYLPSKLVVRYILRSPDIVCIIQIIPPYSLNYISAASFNLYCTLSGYLYIEYNFW